MYGQGILKGLFVTFRHFFNTYIEDLRYAGRRYFRQQNFEVRQGTNAQGIFTVQYPDEKIAVPERFRFTPFLVVNDPDHPTAPGEDWCTSCGICAKVCPPQCIWIVRGSDPVTGRPVPQPTEFFIDIDICMNCGLCEEFCPFDAIKMDHDYELADYDRTRIHIHDKARLSKPFSYWKTIAPTTALEEAVARGGWEHPDVIKAMKKQGQTPVGPTIDNMWPAAVVTDADKIADKAPAAAAASSTKRAEVAGDVKTQDVLPEDPEKAARLAKREAALARKRAAEGGAPAAEPTTTAEVAPAEQVAAPVEVVDTQANAGPDATPAGGGKPKFDKQAMLEKIRQKKGQKGG